MINSSTIAVSSTISKDDFELWIYLSMTNLCKSITKQSYEFMRYSIYQSQKKDNTITIAISQLIIKFDVKLLNMMRNKK
jgi:hypothetical protein